jgi:predicted CoA-binding protein
MNVDGPGIKKILTENKNICVIGLSPDASKPSHSVPMFMRSKGYNIVGVYPRGQDIDNVKIYSRLSEVPEKDRYFVNVFRRSEAIPEVVDEILKLGGTKILWLQLGISHPEAEKKAEAAGIQVVSDRCLLIEYRKWMS